MLHSQLYGRAKLRGNAIDIAVLFSKGAVYAIVDAAYRMDLLSFGNAAHSDCVELIRIRRLPSETYANYEDRFRAAVTKLNSNGDSVSSLDTLAARSLI